MADFENAKVLHERGQVAEAVAEYDELLNQSVGTVNVEVLFYYGTALYQLGKYGAAAVVLKQCIDARPTMQSAFQNLGNCYRMALDFNGAEEIYKCGLELGPMAELEACLGGLWVNRGNPQKALYHYERAIKLEPKNEMMLYNSSLPHLEMGNWQIGWRCYEIGYQAGLRNDRQYSTLPKWQGEHGKTLIVWGEQGLGDEIMFASIIPDLQRISKRVIFDCHPRLKNTFKRSFPDVEIHGTRKNYHLEWVKQSDADAHCSVTTAAMYLRNSDADFPGTPYLTPSPIVVINRARMSGRMRIGVSWAGGTATTRMDARSFPLETLAPVFALDADFYSLQYTKDAAREVCALEENTGIHLRHWPEMVEHKDYDETINFIASMDLVITVCTTVHHAAGALGVPTWTMVPSEPAWRYGVKGTKTPWYASSTLYRQKKGELWNVVVAQIAADLQKLLKQRAQVAA